MLMMRRQLVVACCVLLFAAPAFAQSPGAKSAKADPISGTWTGQLVPQNDSPVSITMELKFDGKSVVSGTLAGLPNPGDVKTGTFDPKTGALKLQLGKTGEGAILLILEGTVVKGTATGRLDGEVGRGEFKITRKP
jgi:hypothetical protein